jgi:hypothetical protein
MQQGMLHEASLLTALPLALLTIDYVVQVHIEALLPTLASALADHLYRTSLKAMPGLKLLKMKLRVPLRMPSMLSTRSPVSISSFSVDMIGRPAPTVVCSEQQQQQQQLQSQPQRALRENSTRVAARCLVVVQQYCCHFRTVVH